MHRFRSRLPLFFLALAAALLLLRPAAATMMAAQAGMLVEICSVQGKRLVNLDQDGPAQQAGQHDCGQCCLGSAGGAAALPSADIAALPVAMSSAATADFSHPFLNATVLAPASRGPPIAS
jgi:hypothetical protein